MSHCKRPPRGWICHNEPGHDGPCPTWPRRWNRRGFRMLRAARFEPGPNFVPPTMALDSFPAEPVKPMTGPERVRAACDRSRGMHAPSAPVTLCGAPPPRALSGVIWGIAAERRARLSRYGPPDPDEVYVILMHPDLLRRIADEEDRRAEGLGADRSLTYVIRYPPPVEQPAHILGLRVIPDEHLADDGFQLAVTRPI